MNNVSPNTIYYNSFEIFDSQWIDENAVSNDYDYESNEGVIVLKDGVTEIADSAFADSISFRKVTIPSCITKIGPGAFAGSGIECVTIPDSVEEICDGAFFQCFSLNSIFIPRSVEKIGDEVFGGCTDLTSIVVDKSNTVYDSRYDCNAIIETQTNKLIVGCMNTVIPNDISEIEAVAFYCCDNLTSALIPDSVRRIGDSAFSGTGITSLYIPNSVTRIGEAAFCGCSNLNSIEVDTNNVVYESPNNCNAIIETRTQQLILGCANTIIPNYVKSIASGAFCDCERLEYIDLPESIESIGKYAFSACTSLTSVKIPINITEIEDGTFNKCSRLASVKIHDSITKIGVSAFYDCGLTEIKIPATVFEIADSAFIGCGGLKSIVVDDRNPYYDSRENCNALIETQTGILLTGSENSVIPDSVTEIATGAFMKCSGLKSINIPDSVTKIGEMAFYCCEGLTSINIPDSVTEIGPDAFNDCFGLNSVSLPNSLTEISDNLFWQCNSLKSVVIPNSVERIGKTAFWGCTGLETVIIPYSVTEIGEDIFAECDSLREIVVPRGMRHKFDELLDENLWSMIVER